MKDTALGVIETFGFVPAVEAADTAVKAANVEIQGCRYVGAGLVSVLITGDVSSVKASVDAGKTAAERLGQVISTTVIARTGEGLETILVDETESPEQPGPEPEPEPTKPEPMQPEQPEQPMQKAVSGPGEAAEPADNPQPAASGQTPTSQSKKPSLETMSVKKLRNLARTLDPFSIARKKIKFARKDELVKAISDHYRQKKE
ncbi:MAG: BMC domain-containing protein [Desulfobacteraceae bacterium]|nr:BMC domain-containing protein [Desulfobacteraceae bacterium]